MTKKTLPAQWNWVRLSEVAEVRTGLALGRDGHTDPVRLPYLRVANVQDGFLDLAKIKYVTVERAEVERFSLRVGDVLMTEGGDFDKLGRGYIWNGEIPNCLHQNHVFAVRPYPEALLAYHLASLTSSEYGRKYFQSCSKQSTNLASINSSQLKSFPIPLPPFAEQKAIAAVLSAWDRAIRQTETLIAAKQRLKRGLMQQLLTGKRRLSEFRGEWKETVFGSFMSENRLPGSNGESAQKLTVRLYGRGVSAKQDARPGSESTKYYRRCAGQFIYSKLDFLNGAFGIIPPHLDGYESTLDLPAFNIDETVDFRWLLYFVSREEFYEHQLGLANGGRKARRVNPSDFLKIAIPLPSKPEQARIADVLSTLNSELRLLTQQLTALKTQKKGLMRKLLTGEVRVPLQEAHNGSQEEGSRFFVKNC